MTRKHFIMLAIELGDMFRDIDRDRRDGREDLTTTAVRVSQLMLAQGSIMSVCKRSNPNFDREHFVEFVQEIRRGERDLDGKKVPASKRANVPA